VPRRLYRAYIQDLLKQATELRDLVKFGDPLYLARTYGKGRVTVVTTTAGPEWNDWATGLGGGFYSIVATQMERYLSGGADDSVACGMPIAINVDAARYRNAVGRSFLTVDYASESKGANARPAVFVDRKTQVMDVDGTAMKLNYTEDEQPGIYLFTFTKVRPASAGVEAAEVPEFRAVAVNIDPREGDLRRAGRDDILQQAPGASLHSVSDTRWLDELKNRRTDWTEAGWIFLVLMLVLMAEQWLSSKLSHNTQSNPATLAPSGVQSFPKPLVAPSPANAA
jgi:hypothetical protein